MFDKVKKMVVNDIINTPIPVGKVLFVGSIIVVAFILTHKMKVVIVFN